MGAQLIQKSFNLTGTVQGVGFRPALYRLAACAALGGWVQNRSGSVRLVLEGDEADIDAFVRELPKNLPAQARLQSCTLVESLPIPEGKPHFPFRILESRGDQELRISFPPDLALCHDCLKERGDPDDRRYGYPFTTCTDCGPRYTVINGVPYDRNRTTLSAFPICDECRAEYEDPAGRRFHAESIACPKCGPSLFIADKDGRRINGEPLPSSRCSLTEGGIVAVRGIGGFLLAADAFNSKTLSLLRLRKLRPHKPFAVMAASLEVISRYCRVNDQAAKLLCSPAAPIVVLDVREDAGSLPLELLSPDTRTLGVMLPTSPLHWLLFNPIGDDPVAPFELLVMTSGNQRSEPICLSNEEAFERLGDIADLFLCHNREINMRADDSLYALQGVTPQIWRRARGLTPQGIRLTHPLCRRVLAMGAELKNVIALGEGAVIVPSAHIGDLETPEAVESLRQAVDRLPEFLYMNPEAVAVDLHPDMHSSLIGREYAAAHNLPLVDVQHHFAHAAACMAEHGETECLALVFDGTGMGTDGTIWGAELLCCQEGGFKRLATFEAAPLPGGDAAVKEPARQVIARWSGAGVELNEERLAQMRIDPSAARIWQEQIQKGLNTPLSHSAGRLFDAFSAALGLAPETTTYDGQTAIRLEAAAAQCSASVSIPELPFSLAERDGLLFVDWAESFRLLGEQDNLNQQAEVWALAAHRAVSRAAVAMVEYGLAGSAPRTVALSGGVFMNRILTGFCAEALKALGLRVLIHREVPPNDGGVAVGQAYVAGWQE